jgi:hypothetical protein
MAWIHDLHHRARHAAHTAGKHLQRAATATLQVARAVDRGVQLARPMYTYGVRPALHASGISSAIPDRALSTYDGIRRSLKM